MTDLSKNNVRSFSLSPYLYASLCNNSVILLDGKQNKYLSLIDDAAQNLRFVLEHEFMHDDDGYRLLSDKTADEDIQGWIEYFLEQNMIVLGDQRSKIMQPLQDGGLIEYRWDTKTSWKPFSQASFLDILSAWRMLRFVHKSLENKGMLEIMDLILSYKIKTQENLGSLFYEPSSDEIKKLAAAVDAASLLYRTQTLCLAWAATFALLALRKNWKINFAIGVQTNPFYAHAWVEKMDGSVINDDQQIARALAVLFKEPYI